VLDDISIQTIWTFYLHFSRILAIIITNRWRFYDKLTINSFCHKKILRKITYNFSLHLLQLYISVKNIKSSNALILIALLKIILTSSIINNFSSLFCRIQKKSFIFLGLETTPFIVIILVFIYYFTSICNLLVKLKTFDISIILW